MINDKHKIIVAVTGASGAIYANVLFDKLLKLENQIEKIGVIMSKSRIPKFQLLNDSLRPKESAI